MLGNTRTAIMASIASAFAGSFDRGFFTGSRTASIGRRNGSHKRSQKRSALRHGRGDGYEMHDGILHKQKMGRSNYYIKRRFTAS